MPEFRTTQVIRVLGFWGLGFLGRPGYAQGVDPRRRHENDRFRSRAREGGRAAGAIKFLPQASLKANFMLMNYKEAVGLLPRKPLRV